MRRAQLLLAFVAAAATSLPASAQTSSPALRAAFTTEIAAIQTRLAAVPDSQGLKQTCEASVTAATQGVDDGRYLAAIAAIRRCLPYLTALEVLAKHKDLGNDLDGFRRAWEQAGVELKARRAALGDAPGATAPLAVRAMIESSLVTFDNYYTSALLYGENTTVESGLLYLGFPYGIAEFTAFAASLPLTPAAPAPSLPDLGGALFALDGDLLDFYKAQTTPEARGALAGTNSMFKVAQDLDTAHMSAGLFFEYLRTIESLASNRARASEPPPVASLRTRLTAYAPRNANVDNSIAHYFIDRGRALIAADDADAERRRISAAIIDDVLPAYDRVIAGEVPAAPDTGAGAPVTVTLVRWPYT